MCITTCKKAFLGGNFLVEVNWMNIFNTNEKLLFKWQCLYFSHKIWKFTFLYIYSYLVLSDSFVNVINYELVLSVQFSGSDMSNSLQLHGLWHARLPCPSSIPGACSNSCPSNQWCHPPILSSVIPFSCPQSFPASASCLMSQLFTPDGQSIGVSASASVLLMNIQDWFPLGLTGLISLRSKGLSRVFQHDSSKASLRSLLLFSIMPV